MYQLIARALTRTPHIRRFHKARGLSKALLKWFDYEGVIWPDGNIYLLEPYFEDGWIRRHEFCHLKQWRRYPWTFWLRLYWQYWKYGHDLAPFEVAADDYAWKHYDKLRANSPENIVTRVGTWQGPIFYAPTKTLRAFLDPPA